ncbi:hypothetical protein BO78DRAFT_228165 [Aspergillus sclerotiicarbonarius CBS 121057]|uniref:Uncharacterized protein n=1 Tax=Aspergillus sclerotiicarbonarius (strain CBS 121057 / IBT 28362) TaxID=1448318 RepID=A0A319DWH4_ASPSB|nr:hypothetical protein BO78DRAFT_228165 [Aspergillus sclerotiicarbonarius CBS 121057]
MSGSSRPAQCKRSVCQAGRRLASVGHNGGYLLLCPTASQPRVEETNYEAGKRRGSVHFRPGGAVSSPSRPSLVSLSLLLVAGPGSWELICLDCGGRDTRAACWMQVWERTSSESRILSRWPVDPGWRGIQSSGGRLGLDRYPCLGSMDDRRPCWLLRVTARKSIFYWRIYLLNDLATQVVHTIEFFLGIKSPKVAEREKKCKQWHL